MSDSGFLQGLEQRHDQSPLGRAWAVILVAVVSVILLATAIGLLVAVAMLAGMLTGGAWAKGLSWGMVATMFVGLGAMAAFFGRVLYGLVAHARGRPVPLVPAALLAPICLVVGALGVLTLLASLLVSPGPNRPGPFWAGAGGLIFLAYGVLALRRRRSDK